jgi:hypothetical protein
MNGCYLVEVELRAPCFREHLAGAIALIVRVIQVARFHNRLGDLIDDGLNHLFCACAMRLILKIKDAV